MISVRKKILNTLQRQVVVEVLKESRTHPTAAEIYEKARKKMEGISLSTVYRNLEKLALQGKIIKLEMGTGPARFDATTAEHAHIRCTECGKVDDVPAEAKLVIDADIEALTGYGSVSHRTEFFGICPECGKK